MENQKHILFISSWYPNRNNPTHGIFNRYFADAVSLYHKVSVLHVCSDEHLKTDFECIESAEKGITTCTVYYKKVNSEMPVFSQLIKRTRVIRAFEIGFQSLLRSNGMPDLIQLNVIMPMGIGAYYLSGKYNIPYVINENWSGYCEEDGNYKGFIQKYYTEKIVKKAKAILPTSVYLKEAMLAHGLIGNYTVVPNVVDTARFKPVKNNSTEVTRFIHISSLNDKEKNVSGLIRAFSSAYKQNKKIELNIVGEGIDKPLYENLVRTLALQNVVYFKGRLMGEDLVREINDCDALVMFSNYETFCLVIIEAFACGKPVITSNAGAIKTYMKPELGIMVDKGNEQQLTKAILVFAKNNSQFDRNYIRHYSVENYSYEKIGKKLSEIYEFALQNK